MPSPIAHSVSGYAIARFFPGEPGLTYRSKRGLAWLFFSIFLALAPDLDFIPEILTGDRYHHGFSHSVVFTLAFTAAVWIIGYFLTQRWSTRLLLLTLMLYGSHLLLDFFTEGGPGIQLLWPFTTDYFKSSIAIFPETHHSSVLFQHPGHIVFIAFEVGYAVILLMAVRFLNYQKSSDNLSSNRRKSSSHSEQEPVFPGD